MRWMIAALALIGLVQNASAGGLDLPFLRGSNAYQPEVLGPTRWSGFYFGAQAGIANSNVGFGSEAVQISKGVGPSILESQGKISTLAPLLPDHGTGSTYGGFVGYNSQWEDVVLGVELNYNRTTIDAASTRSGSSTFTGTDLYTYSMAVTNNGTVHVTDYATFRLRAGYNWGPALPYVMAGLAIGRADVTNSSTVSYVATLTNNPTIVFGPATLSTAKNGLYGYGYAVGAGVDVALMSNVFLRGEYEFVRFSSFGDRDVSLNNIRAAVGIKF